MREMKRKMALKVISKMANVKCDEVNEEEKGENHERKN